MRWLRVASQVWEASAGIEDKKTPVPQRADENSLI